MTEIFVSTNELRDTLARMKKFGGRSPGDAGWTFRPGAVRIVWAGADVELTGEGGSELQIRVDAKLMKNLSRISSAERTVRIRCEQERLYLEEFSVPCQTVSSSVPRLLPTGARPLDLLLLRHRHTAEEIQATGLTGDVASAEEKLAQSVRGAAGLLAWAGLGADTLARWVDAHIKAIAEGKDTFIIDGPRVIVAEPTGQLYLRMFVDVHSEK